MESLAGDASADALLDLTPYDIDKQSFLLDGQPPSSTSNEYSSVRYVTMKQISAAHPPNTVGGGSQILDTSNPTQSVSLYDTFTGIIDGISGDLLHGTRIYVLTGEVYEGPFRHNIRHGKAAIVRNFYMPSSYSSNCNKNPILYHHVSPTSYDIGFSNGANDSEGARFYGTYANDYPKYGTLVVPKTYTYHGPLLDFKPHGVGTLIQYSGSKYEGEFCNGLFHGEGVETKVSVQYDGKDGHSVYNGHFVSGLKQGHGEYIIMSQKEEVQRNNDDKSDMLNDEKIASHQELYRYCGQWNNDQKQGEGEESVSKREVYRGQFHANERHGYGMLTFPMSEINCNDEIEESETSPSLNEKRSTPSSKILLTAEGSWRAGIPLDGMQGWTITYQNGDMFTGFASKFLPSGYGVKRYVNKDIYAGEWQNGKREGEGIFIAADGGQEYIGIWRNGRILPMLEEGYDNVRRNNLTDLALSLLNGENSFGNADHVGDEDQERRRALLETIVNRSFSSSIEMLQRESKIQQEYPKSWSDKSLLSKDPKAYLYKNALRRLRMMDDVTIATNHEEKAVEECDTESEITGETTEILVSRTKFITYPNGDTFLGEFCLESNCRDGYGVYESKASGTTYSGNFERDIRHGFGILIHPLGKYCGDFSDNDKSGIGTLILNDSSSYFGSFLEGKFDGRGTLCEKNGKVYVGDWKGGVRDGDGHETLADGRVYMGEFKGDKRHGTGTMLEKAGGKVIYSGFWKENLYHGEGVYAQQISPIEGQCHNLDSTNTTEEVKIQYQGAFLNGYPHGFGVLTKDNGQYTITSKGMWFRGAPVSGKWRIHFGHNDSIYSGEARTNDELYETIIDPSKLQYDDKYCTSLFCQLNITIPQPDGFGTMKYENGDLYIGHFVDGSKHGSGTYEFVDGDCWEGEWFYDSLSVVV